jgi:hypothetical protein
MPPAKRNRRTPKLELLRKLRRARIIEAGGTRWCAKGCHFVDVIRPDGTCAFKTHTVSSDGLASSCRVCNQPHNASTNRRKTKRLKMRWNAKKRAMAREKGPLHYKFWLNRHVRAHLGISEIMLVYLARGGYLLPDWARLPKRIALPNGAKVWHREQILKWVREILVARGEELHEILTTRTVKAVKVWRRARTYFRKGTRTPKAMRYLRSAGYFSPAGSVSDPEPASASPSSQAPCAPRPPWCSRFAPPRPRTDQSPLEHDDALSSESE